MHSTGFLSEILHLQVGSSQKRPGLQEHTPLLRDASPTQLKQSPFSPEVHSAQSGSQLRHVEVSGEKNWPEGQSEGTEVRESSLVVNPRKV